MLGASAVLLEVENHQGLDNTALVGVQVTACDEKVSYWAALVARPSVERGNQGRLVNQAILQREQAEEEIARRVGCVQHGGHLHLMAYRIIDNGEDLPIRDDPEFRVACSRL